MIPSTKYQYELDNEKVLSHEHEELPSSGNLLHKVGGATQPYQPTTTNLDDRYVVTPDLTISSGYSVHNKPGITLVDDAVVLPPPPLQKKKLSSLLRLKLKVVFLFANKNKRKKMQQ